MFSLVFSVVWISAMIAFWMIEIVIFIWFMFCALRLVRQLSFGFALNTENKAIKCFKELWVTYFLFVFFFLRNNRWNFAIHSYCYVASAICSWWFAFGSFANMYEMREESGEEGEMQSTYTHFSEVGYLYRAHSVDRRQSTIIVFSLYFCFSFHKISSHWAHTACVPVKLK